MAPEQLEGRDADTRTDIFALGAVFYEMATGRKAFDGDSHASLIAAILTQEPAAALLANPSPWDQVIAKCLEKRPDDRWQSAEELRNALRSVAEDQLPTDLARRAPLGLTDLWARKRAWALIVMVAALASFGLAAYHLMWRRPSFSIETVQFTKLTDGGGAEVAAISPDGDYIAYTKRRGEKVGLWLRQSHGDLTGGVEILPPEALGIWGLTFSPDGKVHLLST